MDGPSQLHRDVSGLIYGQQCPYTPLHFLSDPNNLRGLLDRSMARNSYKRLKTSLHKPRGNLVEILFLKKCAFKNNLQLLEKEFLSQTNTTPKNDILLNKMAHFQ